jgi:regulator of protease activity HflC (stomatin/prohibitin superfamily)
VDALVTLLREFWRFLWPLHAVRVYQRGIRFRHWPEKDSPRVEALAPGLHFRMWVIEDIEVISVAPDPIKLTPQSLTTKDDRAITVRATILYEITDPVAAYVKINDHTDSMDDIAENHIAKKVRAWTWDELRAGQNDLEKSLKGTLTTRMEPYGVKILEAGLAELVEAKQHRVFGTLLPTTT